VVLDQRLQYVLGPGREGGPGQYAGDDLRRDPGRVDDDVARQGDQ
jgi:hypothetical protein